jgi:hypothetical protein
MYKRMGKRTFMTRHQEGALVGPSDEECTSCGQIHDLVFCDQCLEPISGDGIKEATYHCP